MWFLKIVSAFVLCVLAINYFLLGERGPSWVKSKLAWGNLVNPSVAEGYVHHWRDYQIVLTGSSVATMLPPTGQEDPGVYTINIQGGGGLIGMELVNCTQATPKVVLVEVEMLLRGGNEDLVKDLCDPLTRRLKDIMPALTYRYNAMNLYLRARYYEKIQLDIPAITMSPSKWREAIADRVNYYAAMNSTFNKADALINIQRIKKQVALLEDRGIKVIFYEVPYDDRIQQTLATKAWRKMVAAHFPHNRIIKPPKNTFFYMIDGLHFTQYSGLAYYRYLLREIHSDKVLTNR